MKEGTFYTSLHRRGFTFETLSDEMMTCHVGASMINVFVSHDQIKVQSLDIGGGSDKAFFLGPNRHEFVLDYVDGLKELLS